MTWWHIHLVVWLTAATLSGICTWGCRELGRRHNLLDRPNRERHKQHSREVPLLGGLGLLAGWIGTIGLGLLSVPVILTLVQSDVTRYFPGIHRALPQLGWIAGGGILLTVLGFIDDCRPLPAHLKLGGQVVVAGMVAASAVRITVFVDNPLLTWGLTTFWILLVVNAVNFFDNMDGLAGGTTAISAFLFLVCALFREQYFVALLAATTCGVACGFLVFNWTPASIFMGDAGSHFLGYMLAIIGAMTTFYTPTHSPTAAPVLIPLLVLAMPIFDLFAVVVIRRSRGQPVYIGDNMHISHRFVRMGLSRRNAVISVHLLSLSIGAGAIPLMWLPAPAAVVLLVQAAALLTLVTMLQATHLGDQQEDTTPC